MIRNAIQRFMYGRYGNDQLNVGLMVLYLVLYLLYWLTGADLLYWVSMVVLFTALFRLLSRQPRQTAGRKSQFYRQSSPF
ncbi:MAG: hypothetical protein ACLT5P_07235 [Flavonifractor plautii]